MTIVNACVMQHRAVLASDSLCCHDEDRSIYRLATGEPCHATKLTALPHARCVLSMTGPLALHHRMQCESYRWADIEGAIAALPSVLRAGSAMAPWACGANTAIVVGWSARGCMGLAVFRSEDGHDADVTWCGDGRSLVWACPSYREAFEPLPDTAEQMAAFTRRQLAHYRAEDPSAPAGGMLQVAELTADTITLRRAGDLGMPQERARTAAEAQSA